MIEDNGHDPGMYDQDIITSLHDRVGALVTRRSELKEQLAEIDAGISRYEKALRVLGDPMMKRPAAPKAKSRAARSTAKESLRNSGRWEGIREAIVAFVHEHEEVRQVDFRQDYGDPTMTSGKSSIAFDILRDDNILRISRVDGNSKYYRLTKEALNVKP